MAAPSAPAKSAWNTFFESLRAVDAVGNHRQIPGFRVQYVDCDGPAIHRSLRSIFVRLLAPRIRRTASVPAANLTQTIDDGARYLSRVVMLSMAITARNRLESLGLPEIATTIYGNSPNSIGHQLPSVFNSLIETFGAFHVTTDHHDRLLYVAKLQLAGNARFGVSANEWNEDPNIGATALKCLIDDKALACNVPNLHSTKTDPWWLIDMSVTNEDEIKALSGNLQPNEYALHHGATITTWSPFIPELVTEMTVTASLFFIPACFASVAMRIHGPCSLALEGPIDQHVPGVHDDGFNPNVTAPRWTEAIEWRVIPKSYTVVTDGTTVTGSRKRRRVDDESIFSTPQSDTQIATLKSTATDGDKTYYTGRRYRWLYDHSPVENQSRASLIARFASFSTN